MTFLLLWQFRLLTMREVANTEGYRPFKNLLVCFKEMLCGVSDLLDQPHLARIKMGTKSTEKRFERRTPDLARNGARRSDFTCSSSFRLSSFILPFQKSPRTVNQNKPRTASRRKNPSLLSSVTDGDHSVKGKPWSYCDWFPTAWLPQTNVSLARLRQNKLLAGLVKEKVAVQVLSENS